jgi:hypothetical protein
MGFKKKKKEAIVGMENKPNKKGICPSRREP